MTVKAKQEKPHSPTDPRYNIKHPLARGLVFGVAPGGMHREDIVSGNFPSAIGSGSFNNRRTSIGPSWNSSSQTTGGVAWPITERVKTIKDTFTILLWTQIDSAATWAAFFSIPYRLTGSWFGPFHSLGLLRNSSNANQGRLTKATSVSTSVGVNIGNYFQNSFTNDPLSMHAITVEGTVVFPFVNKDRFGEISITGGDIDFSTAEEICINYRSSNPTGEGWDGATVGAFLWNRALTHKELQELYSDPWQFVRFPSEEVHALAIVQPDNVGVFTGTSDFPASGSAEHFGDGVFTGTASFPGIGLGTFEAVGAFAGVADFPAVGTGASVADGAFAGVADFPAIGTSQAFAVGSFTGLADFPAEGASSTEGIGEFAGVADFPAEGAGPADGIGEFSGTADFPGVGEALAEGVGVFTGASAFPAIGFGTDIADGEFAGTSNFPAIGLGTVEGVGVFTGASSFPAVSLLPNETVGTFLGQSTFFGVGVSRDTLASTGQRFGKGSIGNQGGRGGVARTVARTNTLG